MLAVYLGIERKLDGLLRGDYCFGTYERLDHPRFEVFAWPDNEYRGAPDLLLALDRNEPPLYRQLLIEIDHEVKVTAFNEMSERMRRRVLELREESLREDSPEDQRWLATYFPETFTIDEATATIR